MLYFIKKIAYREGGFIILEEEGFINQQARLPGAHLYSAVLGPHTKETSRKKIYSTKETSAIQTSPWYFLTYYNLVNYTLVDKSFISNYFKDKKRERGNFPPTHNFLTNLIVPLKLSTDPSLLGPI